MATNTRLRKKYLSSDEIEKIINESDDGLSDDLSDDEDLDQQLTGELSDNENLDDTDITIEDIAPVPIPEPCDNKIELKRPLLWKAEKMLFRGPLIDEDDLEADSNIVNPFESFLEYLNDDFWGKVSYETNLYSVQTRNHRSVNTSKYEIMKVAGVHILMGTLKYPQARLYWQKDLSIPIFAATMSRDQFFEIRKFLHFADNSVDHSADDKLWKVNLILNAVKNKCLSLPRPKHLSLDEQMIPFAGRCGFRQYVPLKPNPLGLKNFVLSWKRNCTS